MKANNEKQKDIEHNQKRSELPPEVLAQEFERKKIKEEMKTQPTKVDRKQNLDYEGGTR